MNATLKLDDIKDVLRNKEHFYGSKFLILLTSYGLIAQHEPYRERWITYADAYDEVLQNGLRYPLVTRQTASGRLELQRMSIIS